jgi:predicted nucleic acid-binding protein
VWQRPCLARLVADGSPLCISTQVCREFLVVLTRAPVEGRVFTVDEALSVLAGVRASAVLLYDEATVSAERLALVRKHDVKGKQVHDANIVATMLANGIGRLATLNARDFKRFEDEIALEPLVS